jgi:hypothetical protein
LWSNWWNEDWQGKPKYSEKTCPSAILSTTNPTWPEPCANPGRRGGKLATNRLSYGAACQLCLVTHWDVRKHHEPSTQIILCSSSAISRKGHVVWDLSNTKLTCVANIPRRREKRHIIWRTFMVIISQRSGLCLEMAHHDRLLPNPVQFNAPLISSTVMYFMDKLVLFEVKVIDVKKINMLFYGHHFALWELTVMDDVTQPAKKFSAFYGTQRFTTMFTTAGRSKALLATCLLPATCFAYFSILNMEAVYFPETLVNFYWTTQRYIPEYNTFYGHRCENLKFSNCNWTNYTSQEITSFQWRQYFWQWSDWSWILKCHFQSFWVRFVWNEALQIIFIITFSSRVNRALQTWNWTPSPFSSEHKPKGQKTTQDGIINNIYIGPIIHSDIVACSHFCNKHVL